MVEGNNKPPERPRTAEIVDFQKRYEEMLIERAETEFSSETEEFLRVVRKHLSAIDGMSNPAGILQEIQVLASTITVKSGDFIEEGIPVREFERIGDFLRLATNFAQVAERLSKEGKSPDQYQNSLREAKETIFGAAIILYDEMKKARTSGPQS